jgi:DNA-binding SARP family transcriptional activator
MPPVTSARIQVCGPLVVELDGRRVERELPGRQGRLLFIFIALHRYRPVRRPELVEALWPYSLPPAAEATLSSLVSRVRRALGSGVLTGRSELELNLPAGAFIDLESAREAIHRAESAAAHGDSQAAWGPARVALNTAARGFLDGEDAPWTDETRREVKDIELRAHECVARVALALRGAELAAAKRSARALTDLEPLRESGYRYLMEALLLEDNPGQALTVYEELRQTLKRELGVAPSEAAQALHRRLLR